MVIEDMNLPSEIRRVVIPSKEKGKMTEQPTTLVTSLPLVTLNQEGAIGERAQPTPERTELE